jgi:tRNA(adenine34) deaminase
LIEIFKFGACLYRKTGATFPGHALYRRSVAEIDQMKADPNKSDPNKSDPKKLDPMGLAFVAARAAGDKGEVPVGAVVVCKGEVIAEAGNRVLIDKDPTAHAEILAIRAACRELKSERLVDCDLYVTLEPCAMCATAISFARLRRLYFAAADPKGGAVEHGPRFFSQPTCHHSPEVYGGLRESEAADMLRAFFRERR